MDRDPKRCRIAQRPKQTFRTPVSAPESKMPFRYILKAPLAQPVIACVVARVINTSEGTCCSCSLVPSHKLDFSRSRVLQFHIDAAQNGPTKIGTSSATSVILTVLDPLIIRTHMSIQRRNRTDHRFQATYPPPLAGATVRELDLPGSAHRRDL